MFIWQSDCIPIYVSRILMKNNLNLVNRQQIGHKKFDSNCFIRKGPSFLTVSFVFI